jgi:glyoxylase-like metal-dependent hydrolase (beta-lactamase superfamily II)
LADATYPNERTRNAYFHENFLPLTDLCDANGVGTLRILSGDARLNPQVRVQVTPGHTRAHQVVIVESQGQSAVFLGDAAGYALNLERLAWVPAFDVEPLVSMETKRSLRDWAFHEDVLLFFQHDTSMAAGRLCRPEADAQGDGAMWRVEPVAALNDAHLDEESIK